MSRNRRGLTLGELIVVIILLSLVMAVSLPSINNILAVQQQAAVKDLAKTYILLLESASLQNCSFRVVFNLDRNTWKVEVGDPGATVFGTPEDLEEHRKMLEKRMKHGTKQEEEEAEAENPVKAFEQMDHPMLKTSQQLPEGIVFDFVYTPAMFPR